MANYTYRAVDENGKEIFGRIEEQNFSDITTRDADRSNLLEIEQVALTAARNSGRPTRVLRDDGTVAREINPHA